MAVVPLFGVSKVASPSWYVFGVGREVKLIYHALVSLVFSIMRSSLFWMVCRMAWSQVLGLLFEWKVFLFEPNCGFELVVVHNLWWWYVIMFWVFWVCILNMPELAFLSFDFPKVVGIPCIWEVCVWGSIWVCFKVLCLRNGFAPIWLWVSALSEGGRFVYYLVFGQVWEWFYSKF